MAWRAETDQSAIVPRTRFTIWEEPWGDGVPMGSLSPGDKIAVSFPGNARAAVEVVSVARDTIVIRTAEKGAKWLMRPATSGERALAAQSQIQGNPPTLQYWIVELQYWIVERAVKREAEEDWGRGRGA